MIKKFKNGNITIISPYFLPQKDINHELYANNIDKLYNNEITMQDMYFNQINGYMYLVDFNTQLVYDFSDCYTNVLIYLDNQLKYFKTLKLYAMSKKESKSLLEDLENGY